MIWPDPTHKLTHPSTHPPNYTPTHGWGSLHSFQIFKQNWNILISSSAIEFLLFTDSGGPPRGWGGGWIGVGDGERVPPHTCTHMHACIWHHREFPGIPQKSNIGGHLHEIIMFTTHACACVCMCACAHVWRVTPNYPHPIHPSPHPQSHREPKSPKFNKSWTNQDNLILFEDSLPLNTPELI